MKNQIPVIITFVAVIFSFLLAQEAPMGAQTGASVRELKTLVSLKGNINGKIVWSTSRSNSRHDLWIMNADGTDQKQLTRGDEVDWYPRFSPDGNRVLFTRSKCGWVPESEANVYSKWNTWIFDLDSNTERLIAEDCVWATWRPSGDSVVFARGAKVFIKDLKTGGEEEIFDAESRFKKGVYSQQPILSKDGDLLAVAFRGTMRDAGIWNLKTNLWNSTGMDGCYMEFFPDCKRILQVIRGQGNGGTEIVCLNLNKEGKPLEKFNGMTVLKNIIFMDLPGSRSHEYCPKLDHAGKWMVWCSTQYSDEIDVYDYEIYLWNIFSYDFNSAIRLTFHSANDRWPDIFTGVSVKKGPDIRKTELPVPDSSHKTP